MNAEPAVTAAIRRDRVVVAVGLLAVLVVTWVYTVQMAWRMSVMPAGAGGSMGLHGATAAWQPWTAGDFLRMLVMWSVMMVAMMVPSIAATVLAFGTECRQRRSRSVFVATSVFLAGYLAVWTGYSLLATLAQWGLHAQALLSPMMASASPWLGGGLLLLAGVFQFTRTKHTCLRHCSDPRSFLHHGWKEGVSGAWAMGLHHGVLCAGCCWALMALLFVGGVMSLAWMAALTLLVLLERALPGGDWLRRATGVALVGWGAWVVAVAVL